MVLLVVEQRDGPGATPLWLAWLSHTLTLLLCRAQLGTAVNKAYTLLTANEEINSILG